MKCVVQRVARASVEVQGRTVGSIGRGLVVLAGMERGDMPADRAWTAAKLPDLRIFEDADGKMNLSVRDLAAAGGEAGILLVSNFTLAGDARKGRRPSFDGAMPAEEAREEFARFVEDVRAAAGERVRVETGEFRAMMRVSLVNDGPVTLILHSRERAGG